MPRVLIVEPAEALRRDLMAALRRAGYQPDAVGSIRDALARLATTPADLVLADVGGARAGAELDSVRGAAPGTPIVAMSADPSVEAAVEAMKRGARDFLRKPFSVAGLESALEAAERADRPSRDRQAILTADPRMQQILREATAAAATDATLQIVGESGTGKDLLARFVHAESPRCHGPFVAVNCAALPESLAASELFGHERGAFSGASESRLGQVSAAEAGTLLLDEVGSLALSLQPKFLRVIQEREVLPVGAVAPHPVDVRVIATTQRELLPQVEAGRFREDLYYRLDVIVLRIPPLRERRADLPLLAGAFLERFAESSGAEPPKLSAAVLEALASHRFRGNVRELENLMRRAVVLFPGREIDFEALLRPRSTRSPVRTTRSFDLKQIERETIVASLAETAGNRTRAARELGISVRTLRNKIRLYGLV